MTLAPSRKLVLLLQRLPRRLPRAAIYVSLTLGLSACGTQAPQPEAVTEPVATEEIAEPEAEIALEPVDLPLVVHPTIAIAIALVDAGDWTAALRTLQSLPPEALEPDQRALARLTAVRADFLRGGAASASRELIRLGQDALLHPELRIWIMEARMEFALLQGAHLDAARIAAALIDSAEVQAYWPNTLWLELHRASDAALRTALATAEGNWRGWLELAQLSRNPQLSTIARAERLERWLATNGGHPAARATPEALLTLMDPPAPSQRIALLLPLTGPLATAASAARDGFLSAYFQDDANGGRRPDVLIIDTEQQGIEAAWEDAVQAGADHVIGPLNRNYLNELAQWPSRQLPAVALNRSDETAPLNKERLTQLALAPEDEAEQLARLAFADGHRRALILRADGPWADKLVTALSEQWAKLGGELVAQERFGERSEMSDRLSAVLGIDASATRAQELRRQLGDKLEFTPRRRQDFDVIFLLTGNPEEARSVRPLLDFHYAAGVPMFATSHAYASQRDPARDRDMEGVTVLALPALIAPDSSLRGGASAAIRNDAGLLALRALGADAYTLQTLPHDRPVVLRGNTGLLLRDSQGTVIREASAARFLRSNLQALP